MASMESSRINYAELRDAQNAKQRRSRLAEVLGIEDDERICIEYGSHTTRWFSLDDGNGLSDLPCKEILWAINHPDSIIRAPLLTGPELERCRVYGAKWVSRGGCADWVDLWDKQPSAVYVDGKAVCFASPGALIARAVATFFPSVKPGDRIGLEDMQ